MLFTNVFSNRFDDMMMAGFPMTDNRFGRMPGQMKSDIREFDDHYDLSMELPGYKKEEIMAELDNGYLTIHAEHKDTHEEKDDQGKVIRTERFMGSCQRSFYVGDRLSKEDIAASYEDGVLHLNIPRADQLPARETKLIDIQ